MNSLVKAAPALFVLLWSTGFIGSKLGAPYIDPMVFLTVRFLAVIPVIGLICLVVPVTWPTSRLMIFHCIFIGLFVHGIYLGGVFWAIKQGMPAGASAIVVGLQPVLTALIAVVMLRETVSGKHWLSLAVGGAGLALVLGPKLDLTGSGVTPATVLAVVGGVLAISFATVYQKRFAKTVDLLPATFWQYVGALLVTVPLSFTESWQITWSGELLFALGWLILVLSIGAILLLMLLIREGAVSEVASLFYLVPVATAVESYFLFDEILNPIQLAGMALVIGAVLTIRTAGKKL